MKNLIFVSLCLLFALGGCKKAPPRETAFVLDISASIDPDSKRQMFTALEHFSTQLHRGDRLIVIPITGDADSDLSGQILDYVAPSDNAREAYDADITRLGVRIMNDLKKLEQQAAAHPSQHSDILGSVSVALGKFSSGAANRELVVLSDFIQDDSQMHFQTDQSLRNPIRQGSCNANNAIQSVNAPYTHVILGRLKSKEFSLMALGRQQAIDCYWHQHLWPAQIDPDGLDGFNEYAYSYK